MKFEKRALISAFADELTQFFLKTCISAQTDFQRGCPRLSDGQALSIFDPRRHSA
jgi:hypothetical protein